MKGQWNKVFATMMGVVLVNTECLCRVFILFFHNQHGGGEKACKKASQLLDDSLKFLLTVKPVPVLDLLLDTLKDDAQEEVYLTFTEAPTPRTLTFPSFESMGHKCNTIWVSHSTPFRPKFDPFSTPF